MAARQVTNFERTVLDALAQDIDEHPEILRPVDAALVERMQRLVAMSTSISISHCHPSLTMWACSERRPWLRRRTVPWLAERSTPTVLPASSTPGAAEGAAPRLVVVTPQVVLP